MIFTDSNSKIFYLDIILHIFFSYSLLTIIFIKLFRKKKDKILYEKINYILNNGVLNGITGPVNNDLDNINALDKIYYNQDTLDKVTNNDVIKFSYGQLVLFSIILVISLYYFDDRMSVLKLLLDKFITFVILGCTLYIFCIYVREKYTEIYYETIYNVIEKSMDDLKPNTDY